MPDLKVSGKTGLTAVAGALGVLVVWGLTVAGVEVPAEVAAAISTLLAAVIAWLIPAKSGSYVTDPADALDWDRERDGLVEDHADEPAPETVEYRDAED